MIKEIFTAVLEMSLSGGAVILAVLVCRALLRRCPKKVTIFLWLPAVLQLLLPVSVPSAVSFFNLLPQGGTGLSRGSGGIPENPGSAAPVQSVIQTVPDSIPAAEPALSAAGIAAVLWLAGMAVMLVWAAVQYGRLTGRVQTAVRMDGERNVYLSENIASPFLLGVLRPRIYVPYHMDDLSEWQVLCHERTHLRLGDHLTKIFAFLILTLHWFNPLCWLAFVLFGRDVEMRCDEAVLAYSDPKEYSTALVRLAVERPCFVTGPLAFGETSVKERVKHILAWKKPALWITIAAVVLCAAVGIVCATDAVESPYGWTSVITTEDLAGESVHYHGEGAWSAALTPAQCEELAHCLQNVPESAMHIGRNIRRTQKSIHMYIDLQDTSVFLFWDGEHVIQRPVVYHFSTKPVWYLDDPALQNFFIQLEKSILAGQGTLDEKSVPVSVSVAGTDTVIAPKRYTPGTWDHEYHTLPVLYMTGDGSLQIDVYWRPESLAVYEEYYHSLSGDAVTIERTDRTAVWDGDSYTLEITRKNARQPEQAVYYITDGEDKYIFKVELLSEDTAAAAAHPAEASHAPADGDFMEE